MLIGEPPGSQFDWTFHLFGVRIRVTPWFWIASLLLGWSGSRDAAGNANPRTLLTWTLAVFASILIHELGHAFAFRRYGFNAHVVLYHFGGLAIPDTAGVGSSSVGPRKSAQQLVISGAGPAAQLVVAAGVIVGLLLVGNVVLLGGPGGLFAFVGGFVGDWLFQIIQRLNLDLNPNWASESVLRFVSSFLYVSVYWALLNLLPIYPLDGGQIARELFLLWDRSDALRRSLILSLVTAVVTALWGFTTGNTYLGILFGMLAYSSYTALQTYQGYGRGW